MLPLVLKYGHMAPPRVDSPDLPAPDGEDMNAALLRLLDNVGANWRNHLDAASGMPRFPLPESDRRVDMNGGTISWSFLMQVLWLQRGVDGRADTVRLHGVTVTDCPEAYFDLPPATFTTEFFGIRPGENVSIERCTFDSTPTAPGSKRTYVMP